jgi:hypothetical protein
LPRNFKEKAASPPSQKKQHFRTIGGGLGRVERSLRIRLSGLEAEDSGDLLGHFKDFYRRI